MFLVYKWEHRPADGARGKVSWSHKTNKTTNWINPLGTMIITNKCHENVDIILQVSSRFHLSRAVYFRKIDPMLNVTMVLGLLRVTRMPSLEILFFPFFFAYQMAFWCLSKPWRYQSKAICITKYHNWIKMTNHWASKMQELEPCH